MTVALSFEQRMRGREERELSPLAARSYPSIRAVAEADCELRTPFQRDRDRIVHCKAFRRLKDKTQVFVAPEGDHYRTRLTHTLEVTGISRTVARALALNEDLTEAIGLGHDLGHTPFGHIGEDVLDRCLRERFGGSFHHWEQSLRVVCALERDGRGLNLTEQVRNGIRCHSGRASEPATLEGAIVRITDRFAYLNHDIDDAVRAGVLEAPALPAEAIAVLGRTGSERIDTLVHDLVEHSERAGAIVQGGRAAEAMTALRDFMFEHVYLGAVARREHSKIETVVRFLFDYYCAHPELLPGPAADLATRVTDYIAGMTDRFCIRAYEELAMPRGVRDLMPRYTSDSRERVRDAVDMVELVGARTELRRAGGDSYVGRCPFHEERTPSFSVKPSTKVYYCFGCQAAGDAFTFVMETEGLDFPGALELLADRYGVALELDHRDPHEEQRRRRIARLHELLDRTCAYYERVLWEQPEGEPARRYLDGRGLERSVLREFRVGFAPSAWDRVLLASRRGGFSEDELLAAGLIQRSRQRPGSVYDRFRQRITFPLCDSRGRVLGFGARATSGEESAKYINSADGDVYHKGRHLFGAQLARPHATRLGSVVLCEGYTDVIAAHQAGVRNCVGLMGTALTDEQIAELGRLASTVVWALDADAAGQAATVKAISKTAELARRWRVELRVAALPAGSDPADVLERDGAEAVRALLSSSVPFVRFRVEWILAAGDRHSPEGRDRILDELRPVFAQLEPGAMRVELERHVVSRLGISERLVGSLLPRRGAAPPGSQRERLRTRLAAGERTERSFLELCIALPERGGELLEDLDLDAFFTSPLTRAAAAHLRTHPEHPTSRVEDTALAALLAQLEVRAAALMPLPAHLEAERCQLALAHLEREIAAARGAGRGGVAALQQEREALKRELDERLATALEETAATPG